MANKRLQPRLAQIGRIRAGDRKGTKGAPQRLNAFRFTVPYASKPILEVCASLYGGKVSEWENPETGREWELYTQANSIKVLILPNDCVVSFCELWNRSGLVRRCDGETIIADNEHPENVGQLCVCPEDVQERQVLAKQGKACSDKTRISVMLPDVPAIGMWRLDTGSYYGATETLGQVALLQRMGITSPVEAVLAIEEHKRKVAVPGKDKPETRRFLVPTLRILMTPKQVLLEMPAQQKQITSGPEAASLLYGGDPEDYEPVDVTDTTIGEVLDETPSQTAQNAPQGTNGDGDVEDFVSRVTRLCEGKYDPVRVLALACIKYDHDHPNMFTEGQQRVIESWLGEGGQNYLPGALADRASEIDDWLEGEKQERLV